MNRLRVTLVLLTCLISSAFAQQPFLTPAQWTALRDESNGAAPYENLRYLTGLHRVPATADFDQAAQFVLARARDYGLSLSLIHISEPTRLLSISYAVFCL